MLNSGYDACRMVCMVYLTQVLYVHLLSLYDFYAHLVPHLIAINGVCWLEMVPHRYGFYVSTKALRVVFVVELSPSDYTACIALFNLESSYTL